MLASHSYEERIDSLTDLEAACIATLDVQQQQQQQQHSLAVLCSSPCCCSRLNKSMLETKAVCRAAHRLSCFWATGLSTFISRGTSTVFHASHTHTAFLRVYGCRLFSEVVYCRDVL